MKGLDRVERHAAPRPTRRIWARTDHYENDVLPFGL